MMRKEGVKLGYILVIESLWLKNVYFELYYMNLYFKSFVFTISKQI